jgi:hypothetical protein
METAKKGLYLILTVFALFLGLCTILVAVVTASQAWQEHAQRSWPQVTARVEKCDMAQTSTGRRNSYYIRLHLSYVVDGEPNTASVFSRTVPGPEVWQYPPNQIAPYQLWVDEHPPGTPIVVRYDPSNHKKVVLLDLMPGGAPHTPNNIKLLEACAALFLALLLLARLIKPRTPWQLSDSSEALRPPR